MSIFFSPADCIARRLPIFAALRKGRLRRLSFIVCVHFHIEKRDEEEVNCVCAKDVGFSKEELLGHHHRLFGVPGKPAV